MKLNKKGATGMSGINTKMITAWIVGIVLLVVFAIILAELIPEFQTGISSIGALNIPFASFFTESGLIVLLLIVAIILVFIYTLLPASNKR